MPPCVACHTLLLQQRCDRFAVADLLMRLAAFREINEAAVDLNHEYDGCRIAVVIQLTCFAFVIEQHEIVHTQGLSWLGRQSTERRQQRGQNDTGASHSDLRTEVSRGIPRYSASRCRRIDAPMRSAWLSINQCPASSSTSVKGPSR